MNYTVTYIVGEEQRSKTFKAGDPGAAFAMCQEKISGAQPIGAGVVGKYGFRITYDAPKVQRPVEHAKLGPREPNADDPEFPLMQEIPITQKVRRSRQNFSR